MTKIIVDSSTLITLSGSCFINIFRELSEREKIRFILPASVYYESVERPIKIRRFELNAIRIREAVRGGYLELARTTPSMKLTMEKLASATANVCRANGKKIRLIDLGEAETLALMKEVGGDILAIDERTTRMLIEEPQNVLKFLEHKHQCKVTMDRGELGEFRQFFGKIRVVRSVELLALAYADGAFATSMPKSKESLEAALFAAKFAGCAVSAQEILDYTQVMK
ncbi:MAG: hypothetical protein NUV67_02045 [archaeon]|nr:hypothetical protein [archaeon]